MLHFARRTTLVLLCWVLVNALAQIKASPRPVAHIRVNQVGYTNGQVEKRAVVMSNLPLWKTLFSVVDLDGSTVYRSSVGKRLGKWSVEFPYVYRLDFSGLEASGTYVIKLASPVAAESPAFRIDTGANLYGALLSNAREFYQAQRDGRDQQAPSSLRRVPCHSEDETAIVYQTPLYSEGILSGGLVGLEGHAPVDVSGGWFDAGDYVKFVETASYTTSIMLLGARDYPEVLGSGAAVDFAAEGRFGLEWLLKMWNDETGTLYYQVGIGDGNDSIMGDHDWWRLPEEDDALPIDRVADASNPRYYLKYRPVFVAGPPGSRVSPNIAGRLAACFALGYQLFKPNDPAFADRCLLAAQHVFDLADTEGVRALTTASPPDFYPETEWRDDMEFGAAELYRATAAGGLPEDALVFDPLLYLELGGHWAAAYINSPDAGGEPLGLYDVAGLAHRELHLAMKRAGVSRCSEVSGAELLQNSSRRLKGAMRQAARDPFGLGLTYTRGQLAPNAMGLALEASFHHELSQSETYANFSRDQVDFLLGRNAWGTSFVVGAGTIYPRCIHHQIANLSGSLDGSPPVLLGATVGGPTRRADLRDMEDEYLYGMHLCEEDAFDALSGRGSRYMDDVRAWPTVEPTLDYTALTILLFARQASGL